MHFRRYLHKHCLYATTFILSIGAAEMTHADNGNIERGDY